VTNQTNGPDGTELTNFQETLRGFLEELCVNWGFCIPREEADRIARLEQLTADKFANELLLAEGFIPEYELEWRRRIRRRFIEKFGTDTIRLR
jgi:hypothetical protein